MAPLFLALALAAPASHIAFVGAVVTPTAPGVPLASPAPSKHTTRPVLLAGRFDGPARVVSVRPARQGGGMTEVVVTYL